MNFGIWRMLHASAPRALAKWLLCGYKRIEMKNPGLREKAISQMLLERRYSSPYAPQEFKDLVQPNSQDVECLLDTCICILDIETQGGHSLVQLKPLIVAAFKAMAETGGPSLNSCHSMVRLKAYFRILEEETTRLSLADELVESKRVLRDVGVSQDTRRVVDNLTQRDHQAKKDWIRDVMESHLIDGSVHKTWHFKKDQDIRDYIRYAVEYGANLKGWRTDAVHTPAFGQPDAVLGQYGGRECPEHRAEQTDSATGTGDIGTCPENPRIYFAGTANPLEAYEDEKGVIHARHIGVENYAIIERGIVIYRAMAAEDRVKEEEGEQADAGAQFLLGRRYDSGHGVPRDYRQAANWYRKAAEQGHVCAQILLGWCYRNGHGVAQDDAEAVMWYRKAAEQGDAGAQFLLGRCYEQCSGIPEDHTEAVDWYRKAAEQGDADAQCNLGICYGRGHGVPQDHIEAVKWCRAAAEQGDSTAQSNLGACYQNGLGVPQDYAEAVKWYRKAVEQDDALAQFNLGCCYGSGAGVGQDHIEAVKWYRKAAAQGHSGAQYNLGWCYEHGNGVPTDRIEALKWFRLSAEQETKAAEKTVSVAALLSPQELQEAERRCAEFKTSHQT